MIVALPGSLLLVLLSVHLHRTFASPATIPIPNLIPAKSLSGRDTNTASVEYTNDDDFREAILNVTNTYRKQHNATSLKWNDTLAEVSKKWSGACVFKHSGGPTGENLASGYANASASLVAWGQERTVYDFKKGAFTEQTGHFTQMVWKATTSVGCGRTECNGKGGDKAPGWYVVCEYYPPGNVIGAFTQNVQAQVSLNEQPEGPSDPEVPTTTGSAQPSQTAKQCPQGGVCSRATRIEGSLGALWLAVLVVSVGLGGLW